MKLLLDQNLSRRLVARLESTFPGSAHVSTLRLSRAPDEAVWERARANDFVIVTKDADFSDLLTLRGAPPYVVWVRRGNCTTGDICTLLEEHAAQILDMPHGGPAVLELL